MRRHVFSRLRYRLLLLVVLAALPALGLIVSTAWEQRRLAATGAQEEAFRLARLASTHHERLIEGARPLLTVLAQNADVQNRNRRVCGAVFADILRRVPVYTNLGAVGPDGDVFCSAVPLRQRVEMSRDEQWRRAFASREFTVSSYRPSPDGSWQLTLAQPSFDDGGKLRALVFVSLDLDWVREFVERARLAPGATFAITDRRGFILAHHPDPESWVGKTVLDAPLIREVMAHGGEGMAEVAGLDGVPRLFAFTPLAGPPTGDRAVVSVGVPREVAFAEGDRLLRRNLLWAGLAFALVLAGALVLGDLVVHRRLDVVVRAAERLTAGDLGARAGLLGSDEIGVMARTFDVMADRLAHMVRGEQRASRALAERVEELDLLNELGKLLQACVTLDEAYDVIGRLVPRVFRDGGGAILAYSASRTSIEAVVAWGEGAGGTGAVSSPAQCWALRSGRPHVVTATAAGPLCGHLPSPPPAAYLCTPLVAQGETIGALYLSDTTGPDDEPGGTGETRLRLAEAVAAQIALGLANVGLRDILRNQSIRDALTGLFNRRYMEETLERELSRARRARRPMGILMVDLDRFKVLNDTAGHAAGDVFLREMGVLFRTRLRREDVACRFGGEEFVLVLPEAALEECVSRAEDLRESVRSLRIAHQGGMLDPVTISIGVAAFPEHGGSGEALLHAADAALYRAKREGRDRVAVAVVGEGSAAPTPA